MIKSKALLPILTLWLLASCQTRQAPEWQLVLRHDAQGNVLEGSKESLIEAVRQGYPVRVGFGGRGRSDSSLSVEHLVDAKFLTITNGSEVFAQIDPIIGQAPNLAADTVQIQFRDSLEWCIILGTNGNSERITTNRLKGQVQGTRSRRTQASWFALKGERRDQSAAPLW